MLVVPEVTVSVVVVVLGTVVTVGPPGASSFSCLYLRSAFSAESLSSPRCRSALSSGVMSGRPCFFLTRSLGLSLINCDCSACFASICGCNDALAGLGVLGPAIVVFVPPPLTVSVSVVTVCVTTRVLGGVFSLIATGDRSNVSSSSSSSREAARSAFASALLASNSAKACCSVLPDAMALLYSAAFAPWTGGPILPKLGL